MLPAPATIVTTVTRSVTRRHGITVRRHQVPGDPATLFHTHIAALRLAGHRHNTAVRPFRVSTVEPDGAQTVTTYRGARSTTRGPFGEVSA